MWFYRLTRCNCTPHAHMRHCGQVKREFMKAKKVVATKEAEGQEIDDNTWATLKSLTVSRNLERALDAHNRKHLPNSAWQEYGMWMYVHVRAPIVSLLERFLRATARPAHACARARAHARTRAPTHAAQESQRVISTRTSRMTHMIRTTTSVSWSSVLKHPHRLGWVL